MNASLAWEPAYLETVVAIFLSMVVYLLYLMGIAKRPFQSLLRRKLGFRRNHIWSVFYERLLGFLLLGPVPLVLLLSISERKLPEYGLGTGNPGSSFLWILLFSAVIVPAYLVYGRSASALRRFPVIRTGNWSYQLVVANIVTRLLYLLSYEFLFRGLLLFICAYHFGSWPAIAISTVMYVLVHLPIDHKETYSSIIFGVVSGIITIHTGTIWVAYFSHVVIAVSVDQITFYHQPFMHIHQRKGTEVTGKILNKEKVI